MKKCMQNKVVGTLLLFFISIAVVYAQTPLLFSNDKAMVQFNFEAATQVFYANNAFWGLAQTYSPSSNYAQNFVWGEGYFKPSIKGSLHITNWFSVYGATAIIASGTLGNDYFLYGTSGIIEINDAYVGLKLKIPNKKFMFDLSIGTQPFTIGNGFVLYNGGANGFERGALLYSANKSWKHTGVASFNFADFALYGFYLENQTLSGQESDKIAGSKLEWKKSPTIFAGFAYFNIFKSSYLYPTVTPGVFIQNGRQGLHVFDLYAKYEDYAGKLAGFSFLLEAVLQVNSKINMLAYGGGTEIGYRFLKLPLMPKISYALSYSSGATNNSSTYSRFDGLYWNGSPTGWSTGGNASLAFINSNIFFQRVRLDLNITPKNIFSASYYYIMAAQKHSPLQFGQTARYDSVLGGVVAGVSNNSLAHDLYFEYTHLFTNNIFLTAGLAVSIPAEGLKEIIINPSVWSAVYLSLAVSY